MPFTKTLVRTHRNYNKLLKVLLKKYVHQKQPQTKESSHIFSIASIHITKNPIPFVKTKSHTSSQQIQPHHNKSNKIGFKTISKSSSTTSGANNCTSGPLTPFTHCTTTKSGGLNSLIRFSHASSEGRGGSGLGRLAARGGGAGDVDGKALTKRCGRDGWGRWEGVGRWRGRVLWKRGLRVRC
ncbi:hypothetical protein BC829DRAFT_265342 [Chytridium lagenaria]|nr:hypothetical protein BC829DRAFT_265342 [Chytridium lagenaria]